MAKVCSICSVDVSTQKRVKDAQGRYYCHICWNAKANAPKRHVASLTTADASSGNDLSLDDLAQIEATASPTSASKAMPLLPCAMCGGTFTYAYLRSVNGGSLCAECDESRRGQSAVLSGRHRDSTRAASTVVRWVIITLILGCGIAIVVIQQQQQHQLHEHRKATLAVSSSPALTPTPADEGSGKATPSATAEAKPSSPVEDRIAELEREVARQRAEASLVEKARAEEARIEAKARQEQLGDIAHDPGGAFKRFSAAFLANLDRYESGEFLNEFRNQTQRNRFKVLPDTAQIDVRRTDSVVSPYIATLSVALNCEVNGKDIGDDGKTFKFTFAAQDNKWVLTRVTCFHPLLNEWLDQTLESWERGLWKTVMEATANP
jgi:hypothetical protein